MADKYCSIKLNSDTPIGELAPLHPIVDPKQLALAPNPSIVPAGTVINNVPVLERSVAPGTAGENRTYAAGKPMVGEHVKIIQTGHNGHGTSPGTPRKTVGSATVMSCH